MKKTVNQIQKYYYHTALYTVHCTCVLFMPSAWCLRTINKYKLWFFISSFFISFWFFCLRHLLQLIGIPFVFVYVVTEKCALPLCIGKWKMIFECVCKQQTAANGNGTIDFNYHFVSFHNSEQSLANEWKWNSK